MAAEQPVAHDDYSECRSETEICAKLLAQVGVNPDAVTPHMLEQAEVVNTEFIARLLTIAEGN